MRTSRALTIVLTENQSGTFNGETVGDFSDGSRSSTATRLSACTLRTIIDLPWASSAAFNSIATSAILLRLKSSAIASRLAISRVVDDRISWTIRRLLALRLEPVSVTSTMASAR